MAAMTTALTEFSMNGNSRTSTTTGHTASKPKLVIEKRKVPDMNGSIIEYSCKVVHATVDADGAVLSQKVSAETIFRYPIAGQATDVAAVLGIIADIVNGDEFEASVTTQNWL